MKKRTMTLFPLPKGGLCTGLRIGGVNSCSTEADHERLLLAICIWVPVSRLVSGLSEKGWGVGPLHRQTYIYPLLLFPSGQKLNAHGDSQLQLSTLFETMMAFSLPNVFVDIY